MRALFVLSCLVFLVSCSKGVNEADFQAASRGCVERFRKITTLPKEIATKAATENLEARTQEICIEAPRQLCKQAPERCHEILESMKR